jgi:hypothetical protein
VIASATNSTDLVEYIQLSAAVQVHWFKSSIRIGPDGRVWDVLVQNVVFDPNLRHFQAINRRYMSNI